MKPADALWEKFDAEVACTYRTPDMVRILDAVDAARAASAEAHQQEIERLQEQLTDAEASFDALEERNKYQCACMHDRPDDVCLVHSPAVEKLKADVQRLTEERDTLKATQLKFGTLQHEFMQRAETAEAERDAALKARDEAQAQLATLLAKWRAESAIGENGYYDERMDGIADCAKELAALLERPQ